jgi:hypothetical protein
MRIGGQRHAPAALYPQGKDLRYALDRGWVGLRADVDTQANEKSFAYTWDRTPVAQSVVRHYTGWDTPLVILDS